MKESKYSSCVLVSSFMVCSVADLLLSCKQYVLRSNCFTLSCFYVRPADVGKVNKCQTVLCGGWTTCFEREIGVNCTTVWLEKHFYTTCPHACMYQIKYIVVVIF